MISIGDEAQRILSDMSKHYTKHKQGSGKKLTEQEIEQGNAMRTAGADQAEIAKALGVSASTIGTKITAKRGRPSGVKCTALSARKIAKGKELRSGGMGFRAIARALRSNYSTVARWCK